MKTEWIAIKEDLAELVFSKESSSVDSRDPIGKSYHTTGVNSGNMTK